MARTKISRMLSSSSTKVIINLMANLLRHLAFSLAFLFPTLSTAQAQQPDSAKVSIPLRAANGVINVAETVLDALTLDRTSWSLALYPAASYSSRSGFAIGIMPMLQIRSPHLPRPATITPSALVSTKRMFEVQCDADVYFNHRLDLTAKFEAQRQPDILYNIGNQQNKHSLADYDFSRQMLTAELLKGIGASSPWRVGVTVDFDRYSFSNIDAAPSDSILANILVSEGDGSNFGLGATFGFDSRNNTLWPTSGSYMRLKFMGYGKIADHGNAFGSATLDARRYIGFRSDRLVLALQAYADLRWGDTPFPKLATCGGTRLGRAIGHNLKYIDNASWLAQAELRAPLFWRVGGVIFGGAGNVGNRWENIFNNLHLMCGAGLRLAVFPGKGLNLRLDGGISNRGDKALYFNIREAF